MTVVPADPDSDPATDLPVRRRRWLSLVYAGDIAGGSGNAAPAIANRLLAATPALADGDPWLACAVGDAGRVAAMTRTDPAWVNRPGGPLSLPPLVAVTHSSLVRVADRREGLLRCARALLDAGADPDQSVGSRYPPASLEAPAARFPLSALYGAAGRNHEPALVRMLLDAGANPDDGESLYHALESHECTRLLLDAGARVVGSNALYRALDLDDVGIVELLLAHGADPNEPAAGPPTSECGTPLLWAIRRRRSPAHVAALLRAGADARARTPAGIDAHRLALRYGRVNVAAMLPSDDTALAPAEQLVAACARGDGAAAAALLAAHPGLVAALSDADRALLPELAAAGAADAVRLMVRVGWPIGTPGGDWSASALNHAVFRGDAPLARFLLANGAHWTERHGFGGDVRGTLAWASTNRPVPDGDWVGCARALRAHGLPPARPDPAVAGALVVDGSVQCYPDEVATILLAPG